MHLYLSAFLFYFIAEKKSKPHGAILHHLFTVGKYLYTLADATML
jgi:hypothetical protein